MTKKNIYDFDTYDIILSDCGGVKRDADHAIKNGVTIHTPEDYIASCKDFYEREASCYDEEEIAEGMALAEAVASREITNADCISSGTYEGFPYVIEYVL